LQQACQDVISSLDVTISRLEQLSAMSDQGEHLRDYYESPQRHEPGLFDKLKKKFLGTSDLDEGPHAVVGGKAGISEVIHRDAAKETSAGTSGPSHVTENESPSRLQELQTHAVPHSAGELATDMALSGVIGAAGYMAAAAGRGERLEATHEKKNASRLRQVLQEEKRLLEAQIAAQGNEQSAPFSEDLLKRELLIVNWQLDSVNYTLAHTGKKKQVGVGSELAGWQMMLKGVIDAISKPVAFSGAGGAHVTEIAASVTGFATTVISPGAAISGLWMGVNAKRFFRAEREDWKALLDIAVKQSSLKPECMPEDIRADFVRVFVEGKWKSHTDRLLSVNKLLNWFVGGMSGYAGAMTGISVHNLVQLAIAGSLIAELSMSGGVITATGAVLIGTLAFLKHHAKFHEYEHWLEEGHPVVDLDLFRELAAAGGEGIGQHAVETLRFYEDKENRRQNFLYQLADLHELRYDGLKLHSTDAEEIKTLRGEQKEASRRNASQRFQGFAARGREVGSYFLHSGEQAVKASEWRNAFNNAHKSVRENAHHHHGHHHHHHVHSTDPETASSHNHGKLDSVKSGLRATVAPLRAGTKIAGRTVTNAFQPAAQKARESYANHTDRLTEIKLSELLLSQKSRELVNQYMKEEAEAHALYAQERLQTAMNGYSSELDHKGDGDFPGALTDRFRKKGVRLARDQEHSIQGTKLLQNINTSQGEDGVTLPALFADIVHLQYWSNPAAASTSEQNGAQVFAKYLWKGAHEEFRKSRLCLTTGLLKLAPLIESGQDNRRATNAERDAPSVAA
jgi:hypothetical protein